jgi:CheY-like chemotaxis protein
MNGDITVESEYGSGSTFKLTITLAKIGPHTHQDNAIIHLARDSHRKHDISCSECAIQNNLYPSKYNTVIFAYKNQTLINTMRYYLEKLNVKEVRIVTNAKELVVILQQHKEHHAQMLKEEADVQDPPVAVICDGMDSEMTNACEEFLNLPIFKIAVLVNSKQYELWNRLNYAWVTQPKKNTGDIKSPTSSNQLSPPTPDLFSLAKQQVQQQQPTLGALINSPNVILIKKPIKLRRLMTTLSGRKTSFVSTLMWNMDMNNTSNNTDSITPAEEPPSPISPIMGNSREKSTSSEQKIQLLLVEDNPINQKLVCRLLNNIGYKHVDLADNGQKAIEKIEERMGTPYRYE